MSTSTVGATGRNTSVSDETASSLRVEELMAEVYKLKQELRKAQKMESIGVVAAGIAHDFNNVLTGLLGYAEQIRTELGPEHRLYEAADYIETSALQASQLAAQLLEYSRRGQTRSIQIDVHCVLEQVMLLFQNSNGRRIQVASALSAETPLVTGDPGQIYQVFLNLAMNARDAMPDGGEITFRTCVLDWSPGWPNAHLLSKGRYAVIAVSDTGNGIPESIRNRIFEPFFTTKEPGKGTGMGLAMVSSVVSAHCGAVEFDNTGLGATFRIYLPLSTTPAAKRARPAARGRR